MFAIIFISHHKQKHSKHFVIWQRDRVATWLKKIEAGRMQWLKMKLRFVNLILLLISSTCAQLGGDPNGYLTYCPCMGKFHLEATEKRQLNRAFQRTLWQPGRPLPGIIGLRQGA